MFSYLVGYDEVAIYSYKGSPIVLESHYLKNFFAIRILFRRLFPVNIKKDISSKGFNFKE